MVLRSAICFFLSVDMFQLSDSSDVFTKKGKSSLQYSNRSQHQKHLPGSGGKVGKPCHLLISKYIYYGFIVANNII